ncbi:MAG: type II secretion system protein [Verrucomicrobiae bacterium]|nr:type II secretion system protein [Verrucomicrobiae bacterium]
MHWNLRPLRRPRGFTQVELLMTAAILTVLAGLLLPAVSRARSRALGAVCRSNLRQWGIATFLFASDNNGLLPLDGTPNGRSTDAGWYVDLPRTMGMAPYQAMAWRTNPSVPVGNSIWICPANPRRSNQHNLFHYCLNRHVNGSGSGLQALLADVPRPQRTIWMFDNGGLAAVAGPNNVHTNLHRRGCHFLMLDGHAVRRPNSEYWDFPNQRGRTDHPELRWDPWE